MCLVRTYLLLGVLFIAVGGIAESSRVVVHPTDTGEALASPSMGWVFHHFDNSIEQYGPPLGPDYAGDGFPGLTVAYLRLAWSYLEPADGSFDWSLVDTAAQRYIRRGRQVAFRFTCFESGRPYATPKWLKEAGVPGRWFRYGAGVVPEGTPGATWEPAYDNPLFLHHLDRFLAAAAARYDGNPNVAFVDIGSIGIWGEGNPCTRGYPLSMYKTHIDLHAKHFRETLLVGMDDWRPRPVFQGPGALRTAFTIRSQPDLKARKHHVRVGIWLPGEAGKGLPEGRFRPQSGRADRRVEVGQLQVGADGKMTFVPSSIEPAPAADADFAVRAVEFRERGDHAILELEWTLPQRLPEGARVFCHVGDQEKDIRQNCSIGRGRNEALEYARSLGATMRDDSIIYKKGVRFRSDWLAADFWRHVPVILESGHYWSNDWSDGADQDYFDAIEAYHGSYVSIHGPPDLIRRDHADIIRRMNRRIGYRLQCVEVSWPESVLCGEPFEIVSSWRNGGVAPCYPGGYPAYTLKDAAGAIRAVLTANGCDVRGLDVGPPGEAPVQTFPAMVRVPASLPTGDYDVFLSVGAADGTPRLALPLPDGDGERRYRVGTMRCRIDGDYRLQWEAPRKGDGQWRIPLVFETLRPLPKNVHPFAHLDLDSRIVKGLSVVLEEGRNALRDVGRHRGCLLLAAPEGLSGKGLSLHVGLWILHGRRILAENGAPDRRVLLGSITFSGGGVPDFAPLSSVPAGR